MGMNCLFSDCARLKSEAISNLPLPKSLFNVGVPPHCSGPAGMVDIAKIQRVVAELPRSSGNFDHSSATAPATWGAAMLVPLSLA